MDLLWTCCTACCTTNPQKNRIMVKLHLFDLLWICCTTFQLVVDLLPTFRLVVDLLWIIDVTVRTAAAQVFYYILWLLLAFQQILKIHLQFLHSEIFLKI